MEVRIQKPTRIKAAGRRQRRPSHAFNVAHLPYVIQPFMIAPVRPSETLVNIQAQCSAYTAPLASRNLGGWLEHVFFYVPVTAMPAATTIMEWFIDGSASIASLDATANAQHYYSSVGTMPDWLGQCMQAIIAEYYRGDTEDGIRETWNAFTVAQGGVNMPIVGIQNRGLLDSLMLASDLPTDSAAPVEDAYAGTLDGLDAQRRTYDRLRLMGFKELTFEEFLHTQGISVPEQQTVLTREAVPELLFQHRQFVMPANAIDPSDGSAASALVWKKEMRGDKDYLFKVPGFIVGVTVQRFKTYLGRQRSAGVGAITSPMHFLPKIEEFREDDAAALGMSPSAGHANTTGIWSTGTADATSPSGAYVQDIIDLYTQGDQFVNVTSGPGFVALPTNALQTRYLALTDINAFFQTSATDAERSIFQDGRVDLTIMSDLRDNGLSVAS